MYVSPQAIIYQASEHEPLLQRWHEGTTQLNFKELSEQLNFIELMFLHAGHARVLANPSNNYIDEYLAGYPTSWAYYIHNTGSNRYRDKPDHEGFAKRRKENPWINAKDQLSIEELLLVNPYNQESFDQRLKFDIKTLNKVQQEARKQATIYVPGVGDIHKPTKHTYEAKTPKKKHNWKKMYFHAHKISEHYRNYPRPHYEKFSTKKIQYNNEKAWLKSKQQKAPLGIQQELNLKIRPRQQITYKNKAPNQPKELPRGANIEQKSFEDKLYPAT